MKKIFYPFLFFYLFSPVVYSKPLDLYNDCLHKTSYCYTYINGVWFGYNRGLFESKKQFIHCRKLSVENIRIEFLKIFENNLYEPSDDEGFLIIDAIKNICDKK